MRTTEDPRRRLRGYTALASAATLTAMTATLAAGSPARAALNHHPGATAPDATSSNTRLTGVSADSATDAWAAGTYVNSSGVTVPLTEHWNGTAWAKVKTPAPSGATDTQLNGVSADSATDAWAAGYYVSGSGVFSALILHWNGTTWAKVKSPAPSGATTTILYAVSADSATDAWAVGYDTNSSGVHVPLTEHWNGTAWKPVATPAPSGGQAPSLTGVSANSATDAWAVGTYVNSGGVTVPLTEHWNGTAWKKVTTPAPSGATSTSLAGVSADSSSDAWAAGQYAAGGLPISLLLHWNGTAWKNVKTPAPSGSTNTQLNGVSAVSPTDAWAVGYAGTGSSGTIWVPLILHWNGTAWKLVASPDPSGTNHTVLNGVSADSASDAWAVGYYRNSSSDYVTLAQHWNGTKWTTVKSPNGT